MSCEYKRSLRFVRSNLGKQGIPHGSNNIQHVISGGSKNRLRRLGGSFLLASAIAFQVAARGKVASSGLVVAGRLHLEIMHAGVSICLSGITYRITASGRLFIDVPIPTASPTAVHPFCYPALCDKGALC